MRALLKDLLKARGTPVLQAFEGGVETILSAGNIWTSAHARRIELAGCGLTPGAVLCSEVGGFQSVIDFVACTIGAFVYLPVTSTRAMALRQQLGTAPVADEAGIMFTGGQRSQDYYPNALPAALTPIRSVSAAQVALYRDEAGSLASASVWTGDQLSEWIATLSVQLETPTGGTRLSCCSVHHDPSFVVDMLLGLYHRQTIYVRMSARCAGRDVFDEAIDLEVDDLVLSPPLLDGLAQTLGQLAVENGSKLRDIRLHTGGRVLSERQARLASSLFGRVFVEAL